MSLSPKHAAARVGTVALFRGYGRAVAVRSLVCPLKASCSDHDLYTHGFSNATTACIPGYIVAGNQCSFVVRLMVEGTLTPCTAGSRPDEGSEGEFDFGDS